MDLIVEIPENPSNPPVPGRAMDGEVDAIVEFGELLEASRQARFLELLRQPAQRGQFLGRDAGRREAGDVRFQQLADRRELQDILNGEFADERAALREHADPPLARQPRERATNRRSPGPQLAGEPRLGEFVAGTVFEREDGLFDLRVGRLGGAHGWALSLRGHLNAK